MSLENGWAFDDTDALWRGNQQQVGIDQFVYIVSHATGMGGPIYANAKMAGDVIRGLPFFDRDTRLRLNASSARLQAHSMTDHIDNSRYTDLDYEGEWFADRDGQAFLKSVQTVSQSGASVGTTFQGSSISVYMVENGEAGQFEVTIDGKSRGIVTMDGSAVRGSKLRFRYP